MRLSKTKYLYFYIFDSVIAILSFFLYQVWANLLALYALSLEYWCYHYRSRLLLETLKHFIKTCRKRIKQKKVKRSLMNLRIERKKRGYLSAQTPMMAKKITHTKAVTQRVQFLFHQLKILSTERRLYTTTTQLSTESLNLLVLQIRIVNLRAVIILVIYFYSPFCSTYI